MTVQKDKPGRHRHEKTHIISTDSDYGIVDVFACSRGECPWLKAEYQGGKCVE